MKRRDTLVRLKRFRVDDLKRRLATLDGMKADLERKLFDLDESVNREKQRANDSDIGRLAFPSFLRSIDVRRENIRNSLCDIEREREQCQGELSAAYQDLKTFELAMEQEAKRAAEAEERRAQVRMDEMAIVRHLRKHAIRQA
jgi:flagellar export protein FliJ